ncbi:MAG: hypothetical protein IPF62_08450 [Bacteroidetes bacterium]|nr:hypothetical protein [Bacteroidota bacterium]
MTQIICQGDSHLGYSATGIFIDTLVGANGCDSIRILNLTVNPQSSSNLTRTICKGENYLGYTIQGIYKDTLCQWM